jgi:hypothetical protein
LLFTRQMRAMETPTKNSEQSESRKNFFINWFL